jgi:hypothetical protein
MKRVLFTAAAAALAAVISQTPAIARDTGSSASVSQVAANGAAGAFAPAMHYEWQYHYVGRHARYVGHWVLVP